MIETLKEIWPVLLGFLLGAIIERINWNRLIPILKKPRKPVVLYVLHPGEVRSKCDGNWHYISLAQLASLYGLKPGTWIRYDPRTDYPSHLVHLYPLTNGHYKQFMQNLRRYSKEKQTTK